MDNFLEIKQAHIGYEKPLINTINATLKLGDVALLMGNNGVGKTTLIKTLLKQLPLLSGQILINGEDINTYNSKSIAELISIVFSKSEIPSNYTVFDLISFGKYIHYPYYFKLNKKDIQEIEDIISRLQLEQYRDTLLIHLSDGNLQKVFIGRALAQNSPVIILDEPTTHLDEDNKLMILKLLRDLAKNDQKLVLFSSHDWRLAKEFSDQLWWVKNNLMISGLTEEVLLNNQDLINNHILFSNSYFVAPEILATDPEKELMYSFLQKNFETDLSKYKIVLKNEKWDIIFNDFHDNCQDFSEVANSLKKRM
ncbi:ABC transporter ATP-binding protein [Chryseobacterium sp. T1]